MMIPVVTACMAVYLAFQQQWLLAVLFTNVAIYSLLLRRAEQRCERKQAQIACYKVLLGDYDTFDESLTARQVRLLQAISIGPASGLKIRSRYNEMTGERLTLGSMHVSLGQLREAGLIAIERADEMVYRFRLTNKGRRAINLHSVLVMGDPNAN